jgi:hypothetical protein
VACAAGVSGATLYFLQPRVSSGFRPATNEWFALLTPAEARTVWGVPLIVAVFSLGGTLYIGLMGRRLSTERREWWGRLGGLLLISCGAWPLMFLIALGSSQFVKHCEQWIHSLNLAVLATTAFGVIASNRAGTADKEPGHIMTFVVTVTPYVFIGGSLVAMAWLIDRLCDSPLDLGNPWHPLIASAASFLVALALSWRFDINEFSMHNFYRNRLARCYQGASDPQRQAHPFTGFAESYQKVRLDQLQTLTRDAREEAADPLDATGESIEGPTFIGPYHIVNTALNLVSGKKLAWQKRKAASFIFSPLFCGFDASQSGAELDEEKDAPEPAGFRPTGSYAGNVKLGAAVAISGAAASPNMGYHSSAPLAFLMTIFNVRLGSWLGNPRREA